MILTLAGMHRSGTSMLARYLHHSGISMGRDLYEDRSTNPYGHYEDVDFLKLQREELARAFDGQDYLVHGDLTPSAGFLDGARRLLEARKAEYGARSWGWKDPRTTLFLEHWKQLEPELRVLGVVRDPRRVVASPCGRLHGYWSFRKKELFLKTCTHYNTMLADFAERHRDSAVVLSLEALVENPGTTLELLSDALNHPFDATLFREQYDPGVISRMRRASLLLHRGSVRAAEASHERLKALSP